MAEESQAEAISSAGSPPSNDWWMYHADERHSGNAAGHSDITSTSVQKLVSRHVIQLGQAVISVPAVVQGSIYIGTRSGNSGGTLYKINLVTGAIQGTFAVPFAGGGTWESGIGSTPAVVQGRVYFTSLDGKAYCVDATTMKQVWATDFRHPDPAHNQPMNRLPAACWSSPLVINGRVYVGSGLGEDDTGTVGTTFGFVHCLDAATGRVIWMFCTNKFSSQSDNQPNVLPRSLVTGSVLAGYTLANDPPSKGASVWSSCVYSQKLNRIYVGTGNPDPDQQLPNADYASGVLALDAGSGAFKGFFQPSPSDSYRTDDLDVDTPPSPLLFSRAGNDILAIGSKNGSFFLLDPNSMQAIKRRQLLPRIGGDGFPGDRSTPIPTVDRHATDGVGNENHSGTYSTAAVHNGLGRLFVGLGGWQDATHPSIDTPTTPFLRVLDWTTLQDAWPTTIGNDHVKRYNIPHQPMYANPGEVALSSPAVVNDVVFVTTNAAALYAFNVANGTMLWQANDLGTPSRGSQAFDIINIGPAVYGNAVVIGTGAGKVHIYSF